MTRLMVDGVNEQFVLALARTKGYMVAGYVDGDFKWSQAGLAQCQVKISAIPGTESGFNVIDCETFDWTIDQAFAGVMNQRDQGNECSVYNDQDRWPGLIAKFNAYKEPQPPYWIAKPGPGILLDGSVATQYYYPGTYDLSIVSDYWSGVDEMNPQQLTDIVTFANGDVYKLRASGEVQASAVTPSQPLFHVYTIKGDDGSFYTFGPDLNGGIFAYPGLPASETLGSRLFFEIRAGEGRW
jgi:hypothetical protein